MGEISMQYPLAFDKGPRWKKDRIAVSGEKEKERRIFRVWFLSSRLNGGLMSDDVKPGRRMKRKSELLP